jgi:integrase
VAPGDKNGNEETSRVFLPCLYHRGEEAHGFLYHRGLGNEEMATKKLTDIGINNLPEGIYWDAHTRGLNLRVGVNKKTWQMRYVSAGKYQFERLGFYPQLSLKEARARAEDTIDRIAAGERVEPVKLNSMTLAELIDRYESYRRTRGERVKSLDEGLRTVRNGLAGYLHLPARQFTKADLREARDTIARRAPTQSNRFLAYLGPVMKWATAEDHIEHNLVTELLRVAPEVKRDRVLTAPEIRAIWKACGEFQGPVAQNYGRLVRFLLVTAQRKDEVASMKHGAILGGFWKQEDNKSGRPHRIKLPQLGLDQIGAGEPHQFVFGGEQGKIGGFSKFKAMLDQMSGVAGWRHHDLRRTAASGMQLIVPPHVVEAVLNHAIPGVAGVYLRAEMDAAKTDALHRWASELETILRIDRSRQGAS